MACALPLFIVDRSHRGSQKLSKFVTFCHAGSVSVNPTARRALRAWVALYRAVGVACVSIDPDRVCPAPPASPPRPVGAQRECICSRIVKERIGLYSAPQDSHSTASAKPSRVLARSDAPRSFSRSITVLIYAL